jgi:hypothetical protein
MNHESPENFFVVLKIERGELDEQKNSEAF